MHGIWVSCARSVSRKVKMPLFDKPCCVCNPVQKLCLLNIPPRAVVDNLMVCLSPLSSSLKYRFDE